MPDAKPPSVVALDSRRADHETPVAISAEHAVEILRLRAAMMRDEDSKPVRQRDSRTYSSCYGAASAIALLFGIYDGDDPDEVADRIEAIAGKDSSDA